MKTIQVSEKNEVLEICLNRPEVKNALNPEMIAEITQAFAKIPPHIRVVVLNGAGDVFCAGADLAWMQSMAQFKFSENLQDSLKLREMFFKISQCKAAVIGCVQGAAFGGAVGLLSVCDVVIAEKKTKFCLSEVKLGIAPAVISPFLLAKIDAGHLIPYAISGKVFSSQQAQASGLVHEICENNFENSLAQWIQAFLECGPEAVAETKKLILEMSLLQNETITARTTELIAKLRVSAEGQEGLKSFLEKRKPSWKKAGPKK